MFLKYLTTKFSYQKCDKYYAINFLPLPLKKVTYVIHKNKFIIELIVMTRLNGNLNPKIIFRRKR